MPTEEQIRAYLNAGLSQKAAVALATDFEDVGSTDLDAHVAATDPHPTYTNAAELASAVDAAISALLAGAPGALNTLDELAAALGDDANYAATITTALAGKQPLDTDLTAIAALTTTSFGRALLALADAAALRTVAGLGALAVLGDLSSFVFIDVASADTNSQTDTLKDATGAQLDLAAGSYIVLGGGVLDRRLGATYGIVILTNVNGAAQTLNSAGTEDIYALVGNAASGSPFSVKIQFQTGRNDSIFRAAGSYLLALKIA